MIFVKCDCGKSYQLSNDKAGKRLKCRGCGNPVTIPNLKEDEVSQAKSSSKSSGQESLDSWDDVRAFILSKYSGSIQDDHGESLTILKFWDDGRSQMVIISSGASQSGVPWICIKSPVGILPVEILPRVCELLSEKVCGGLIKFGERYWVSQSMPIGNTSQDELVCPLDVVASVADTLEEAFVGGDAQ